MSDIVLSASSNEAAAVELPFRSTAINHRANGRVLVGVEQKTVILGMTMLSWSGPQYTAHKILKALCQISEGGARLLSSADLIDGASLSNSEAGAIHLIYNYIDRDFRNHCWSWRCATKTVANREMVFAGSGGPAYADFIEITPPGDEPVDDRIIVFQRLMSQVLSEATSDDTLDQSYGGWFEMASGWTGGWVKFEYAIKFWRVDSENSQVYNDPLLFNYYIDHNLVIGKLTFVGLTGAGEAHPYIVPDTLGRGSLEMILDAGVRYEPAFIAHVVRDAATKQIFFWLTTHDHLGFNVKVEPNLRMTGTIEQRLFDKLFDGVDDSRAWTIKS